MKKKDKPLPSDVGKAVRAFHQARLKLLTAEAKQAAMLKPLKAAFEKHEAAVLLVLGKHRLSAARTELGGVTRYTTLVPSVEDWGAFVKHLLKTRDVDLLQRRVSAEAWRERVEAGKPVPGIKGFPKVTLRAT